MVLQKELETFWKYLSTPTPKIAESLKQWKKEYEKGNTLQLHQKNLHEDIIQ